MSNVSSSDQLSERMVTLLPMGNARLFLCASRSNVRACAPCAVVSAQAMNFPEGLSSTSLICGMEPKASAGGMSAALADATERRPSARKLAQTLRREISINRSLLYLSSGDACYHCLAH